ncbi:hypothetical protein PsorP6_005560 [Peronosclerospora sorghi]|uniref:Uncharacterized protein n=1 Tax=Peronosclerospora sorghi TaxID=230839 RepID=A0ACC0W613_9STRA|nr:hypothetical protein PsorP6_005560 [Peronosclerospora sorghi]
MEQWWSFTYNAAREDTYESGVVSSYEGESADVWSAGVVLFIVFLNQDGWFIECVAEQQKAFWAAHSRSAKFSPGAMSLMTRIFNVKPQERITLADIKSHPWLNEDVVVLDDLRSELWPASCKRKRGIVGNARKNSRSCQVTSAAA